MLVERLTGWADASLTDDLAAYPAIDPADAIRMRDEILVIVHAEALSRRRGLIRRSKTCVRIGHTGVAPAGRHLLDPLWDVTDMG